ncbi:indolepyruvate ferredoxin oxidoreductase subunit alpha [Candidatus Acidianus copahuensis]|nr:indolepyruvate ferredoxin oxidoreductase subunit alpha [Candidatus Acidianus copahuensis]
MIVMRKRILLGNEAIAFGALASGVGIAAGYPGTPSSEIIETIMKYGDNVYAEWSTNEKVALETAYGAAIMGGKALATMKHVGMNVAADALMSSSYTGVDGSLVVVSADDPSMWSSQSEQDNRYYGLFALIPVIEPYDPQSAHELIVKAFDLSFSVKHPVIFRTTTRISHVRAPVELLDSSPPVKGKFHKDPGRFSLVPEVARKDRKLQLQRWEKIKMEVEKLNEIEGDGNKLIIASGIAYAFVKEAVENLGVRAKILKLSTPVPIPKEKTLKAMEDVEEILIVEELDPIVEMQVKELIVDNDVNLKVRGKSLIGREGELTLDRVTSAIGEFFNVKIEKLREVTVDVLPRPPALCPGCPHRSSFIDLKKALALAGVKDVYFSGDIGCYSIGVLPPFNEQDSLIEMGGSLGVANGVYRSTGVIPVAIIGDSTFFHAGLPGLANAVFNKTPMLILVLDNRVTAMTGQQRSPSKDISIAKVANGLGIEYVSEFDPFDYTSIKEIKNAMDWVRKNGKPAVVIAKRACALEVLDSVNGDLPIAEVDENKCTGCTICYDHFTCPAIVPLPNKKAKIDLDQCIGCGACVPICPFKAITIKGEQPKGWESWLS